MDSGSARPMNPERGADRATGKGRRPGVGASDSPPASNAATWRERTRDEWTLRDRLRWFFGWTVPRYIAVRMCEIAERTNNHPRCPVCLRK